METCVDYTIVIGALAFKGGQRVALNSFCVVVTLVIFGRGVMFQRVLLGRQTFGRRNFGFNIRGSMVGVVGVFGRSSCFGEVVKVQTRVEKGSIFGLFHLTSVSSFFVLIFRCVGTQLGQGHRHFFTGLFFYRSLAYLEVFCRGLGYQWVGGCNTRGVYTMGFYRWVGQ